MSVLRPDSAHAALSSELPSKLFFRIGEVASLVGVEPHVLRYWEREFRSIRPTKSAKGQRVYSRKDVENLLRVRDLLYRDGFTIAGAKKRLTRPQNETTALAGIEPEPEPLSLALAGEGEGEEQQEHEREREIERDRDTDHDLEAASQDAVRVKLTALRAEVESFLGELETERLDRT